MFDEIFSGPQGIFVFGALLLLIALVLTKDRH